MSRSEDWVRLRHMLDAAREAVGFAAGRPRVDLDRDRQLLMALFGDLSMLAAVATALNTRPRKTLSWRTPAEAFAGLLRSVQEGSVATTP